MCVSIDLALALTLVPLSDVPVGLFSRCNAPVHVFLSRSKVTERGNTWDRAQPRKPIEIYEFEGCPFCRKVREAVNILDLDVVFYPCPQGESAKPAAPSTMHTHTARMDATTVRVALLCRVSDKHKYYQIGNSRRCIAHL